MSRKRNARGRSQSEKFFRQPCQDFLLGTCTKSPCECWHLPEFQFLCLIRFVNSAISARFRTGRLRNSQTESQRKATFPTKKRKRRLECCGSCENCTTVVLCIPRHRAARICIDFTKGHTEAAQRHADIRENRGPSMKKKKKKTRQTSSSAQCIRYDI